MEMQVSEGTLYEFLHTMPAVLYEYAQREDGTGRAIYISPTSTEILGHPPEYFMEDMDRFWGIVHPDDRSRLLEEDIESLHDSEFSAEARIILPSSEIRWVRFSSKPAQKNDTDAEVIWIGCVTDITPLKSAQEEIQTLHGLLAICSSCKKIRDEKETWVQLERYISERSEAGFTHSYCPDCYDRLMQDFDVEDE